MVTSVHWTVKGECPVNTTAITCLDKQLAEKMLLGNVSGAEQESTAKGQGRARGGEWIKKQMDEQPRGLRSKGGNRAKKK